MSCYSFDSLTLQRHIFRLAEENRCDKILLVVSDWPTLYPWVFWKKKKEIINLLAKSINIKQSSFKYQCDSLLAIFNFTVVVAIWNVINHKFTRFSYSIAPMILSWSFPECRKHIIQSCSTKLKIKFSKNNDNSYGELWNEEIYW